MISVRKISTPFPGKASLSKDELAAFEALRKLKRDSLWLPAIKNVVNKPDLYRFRKLICSLLSQNNDNPEVMKNILQEAYQPVLKLKG